MLTTDRLFNMVLAAGRDETPYVDPTAVQNDVKSLYRAGQGKVGTVRHRSCPTDPSHIQDCPVEMGPGCKDNADMARTRSPSVVSYASAPTHSCARLPRRSRCITRSRSLPCKSPLACTVLSRGRPRKTVHNCISPHLSLAPLLHVEERERESRERGYRQKPEKRREARRKADQSRIQSEFSGHMRDALLHIARKFEGDGDGVQRDADLLEAAMAGMGTKDERLYVPFSPLKPSTRQYGCDA